MLKNFKKKKSVLSQKKDKLFYIQVSDNILDEETFLREVSLLLDIRDAYPKILIVRTRHETYQYEGV